MPPKQIVLLVDRDTIELFPVQGLSVTVLPAKRIIVTFTADEDDTCDSRVRTVDSLDTI